MLVLYKFFFDLFLEQVRELFYYLNLGFFWEVMVFVFFEMFDIYDEGGFKGVFDVMNFLVNGIFVIVGCFIYYYVYIDGECLEIIFKFKGFIWFYEVVLFYVEVVFYCIVLFWGIKFYNVQVKQVLEE